MLTSQRAGNLTLASLNATVYSPSSTNPRVWSLGTSTTNAQQDYDDFQSNLSLQVFRGQSTGISMVSGLGIMYPGSEAHQAYKPGSVHESTLRHHGPMRTEATYGSFDIQLELDDPPLEPLSLSALLNENIFDQTDSDLISNEPIIERQESEGPSENPPEISQSTIQQINATLQHILDTPGHATKNVVELATARLAGNPTLTSALDIVTLSRQAETGVTFGRLCSADYSQGTMVSLSQPIFGVNPVDIMPPPHQELDTSLSSPLPQTPEMVLAEAEHSDPESKQYAPLIKQEPVMPCLLLLHDRIESSPAPLTEQNLRRLEESSLPSKTKLSDYEPSLLSATSTSVDSVFIPSPAKRKTRTKLAKTCRKRVVASPSLAVKEENIPESSGDAMLSLDLPIDYGTPILDAHRGLEMEAFKSKAERYRLRNPGQDYDKKWLLSFAGKLTPEGSTTEEFRCYIIGCNQSNRRRDHIMIHIGGHLGQRPFACSSCSARFLRKNECKRHELSHTGNRPFVCDLCPPGATAFVRQDLLKRHQQRTHNLDTTRCRKRTRRE